MLHIVLLITRLDPTGGAQSHVWTLARGLADGGDDVTLIHGGRAGPIQPRDANLKVLTLGALRRAISPMRDLRATADLWRLLGRLAPDVLHTHSTKAGIVGCLAGRLGRLPTVYTAHGWSAVTAAPGAAPGRLLAGAAHRFGLATADRVVVLSRHDASFAARHKLVKPARLCQLPLGIVDSPQRAAPEAESARLVTIARHAWPKDSETLLQALARCRDLPWTLRWLGGGPQLAATRRRIESLGLGERVAVEGANLDAAEALARACAFVLSSRAEGLPLSLLEAMRAGLPVVASDVGAVREAVGEAGWLVPAGDPAALAAALRHALTSPDQRLSKGAAGRRRFEEISTPQLMVDAHRELYRTLIDQAGTAAIRR